MFDRRQDIHDNAHNNQRRPYRERQPAMALRRHISHRRHLPQEQAESGDDKTETHHRQSLLAWIRTGLAMMGSLAGKIHSWVERFVRFLDLIGHSHYFVAHTRTSSSSS